MRDVLQGLLPRLYLGVSCWSVYVCKDLNKVPSRRSPGMMLCPTHDPNDVDCGLRTSTTYKVKCALSRLPSERPTFTSQIRISETHVEFSASRRAAFELHVLRWKERSLADCPNKCIRIQHVRSYSHSFLSNSKSAGEERKLRCERTKAKLHSHNHHDVPRSVE